MSGATHGERAGALRRFKPYPAYKDSGVEWLGEIPAHWAIARISELTILLNGYPFDSQFFTRGEGTPLVRIRDLNAAETEVNYVGPIVENAWIEPGDVIIGMDGDFNIARWRGQRALLNQRMCCLRPRGGTDSGFIAYFLPLPLRVINDLTYSTTVKHLSSEDVRRVRLGVPPEPEQRAIAAFLDRETARIDALVAKKERLIELLQEKRTALITRAVTKGLDPTVPMKDSGVAWLGEIPAHWEVKKTTWLFSISSGTTPRAEDPAYYGGDTPWITTSELREAVVQETEKNVTEEALRDYPSLKVYPRGSVAVAMYGATIGRLGILGVSATVNQACCVFSEARGIETQFWFYWLQMRRPYLISLGYGGGQPNLSQDLLKSLRVPLPPVSEQRAISAFLDRETARIDALVAKVRNAIERLKELRSALISAAVTGKIDVREEAYG